MTSDTGGSGGAARSGATVKVSYFDKNGQTSSFGIPDGIRGSITAGERVNSVVCAGCHAAALPVMNYRQLQAVMRQAPMNRFSLSSQQLADLAAWLNRDSIPPPGTK